MVILQDIGIGIAAWFGVGIMVVAAICGLRGLVRFGVRG